jgi:hypothetical protein
VADATTTYAIDNNADYHVVVNTPCNRVVIQENYNSANPPTADLLQKMPFGAASAANIAKGTAAVYTPSTLASAQARRSGGGAMFAPGDNIGSIRTVSGSITVQQVESMQI